MTKVTAAYVISRTTRKVAYIDMREDKNIFFFSEKFSFKMTDNLQIPTYTCITCPDVYSRDSKRAKHVILIHNNIITLKTKLLQFCLYSRTYICIRCSELVTHQNIQVTNPEEVRELSCRKMFKLFLQPIQTRIWFVSGNISLALQRPVREINPQVTNVIYIWSTHS